jgi:hypothetical protein
MFYTSATLSRFDVAFLLAKHLFEETSNSDGARTQECS